MPTQHDVTKFSDFPFAESLHQDLRAAGYETPTPIQAKAIGPVLAGHDLIGLAQTGTGKTAAFALPIIHRLASKAELGALVLAPTRELVHQIVDMFRMLGRTSGVRVASVVGGIKIDNDWRALRSWPNVLVATPGRLIDHLEQKTVNLKEIEILVIDEADRMHDMGFIPQIRRIIAALPEKRQTLMFTATMPADVEQIARRSMHDAIKIQVGPASCPVERAEQHLYHLHDDKAKLPLLLDLLGKETGRVLVFMRTKRSVDRLARRVIDRRFPAARLHGDREMNQRTEAMQGFREGRYRILIATDIAARGLDVADIENVINYDFPRHAEDYVHRIGRTARLAATGRATSFVTPADRPYVRDVEKLIGSKLALEPAPGAKHAVPDDGDGHARHEAARGHGRPPSTSHVAHGAPHPHAAPGEGAPGRSGRHHRRGGRPEGAATAPHGATQDHPSHPRAGETQGGHVPTAHEPAAPAATAHPHGPHGQPSQPGQGGRRRRRRGGRGDGQHAPQGSAGHVAVPAAAHGEVAAAPASHPSHGPVGEPHDAHTAHHEAPQAPPATYRAEDIPQKEDPTVLEWD